MSKETIHTKLKPFLTDYVNRLFEEFETVGIIEKVSTGNAPNEKYKLSSKKDNTSVLTTPIPIQKNLFSQLTEFRNVVNNVWNDLYYNVTNNNQPTFSTMLIKLQDNKALLMNWEKRDELLNILDNLDTLGNEEDVLLEIDKIIKANRINLNTIIHNLLEFYGIQKAEAFFSDYKFNKETYKDDKIDLLLSQHKFFFQKIVFEFKFRRLHPTPDKKLLLQSLQEVQNLSENKNYNTYLFIVVFTNEDTRAFNKAQFNFRKIMDEIEGYNDLKNSIEFIPVSITNLHLIENSFQHFKNNYIEEHLKYKFETQLAPKTFPERNDHILSRVFKFKNNNFKIIITPGSTKFWRFGFTFSKDEIFPPITQGRHADKNYIDIHICVGSRDDKNQWVNHTWLTLTKYHIEQTKIISSNFNEINDYHSEPIEFNVISNKDGSNVEFKIATFVKQLGSQIFDLSEYSFCKISAWCDELNFDIDADIQIVHKP